jgi:hypothetical protein
LNGPFDPHRTAERAWPITRQHCLDGGMRARACLAPRLGMTVSYTVQIKQSATGLVRSREEANEWSADGLLWTRGNRACDCARALLFARDGEKVERACGARAYAIRVISPEGQELYREDDF